MRRVERWRGVVASVLALALVGACSSAPPNREPVELSPTPGSEQGERPAADPEADAVACQGVTCVEGFVCQAGKCVSRFDALCEKVSCAPGFQCNLGRCEAAIKGDCGGARCPQGMTCVAGQCKPAFQQIGPCASPCPAGTVCDEGVCVPRGKASP